MEAGEEIKRVDTEERQSSVLSPSPSLFPTIIFDIVCYFCGIFKQNREVVPDFRDDPHYSVVLFKQQVLELTPLVNVFSHVKECTLV